MNIVVSSSMSTTSPTDTSMYARVNAVDPTGYPNNGRIHDPIYDTDAIGSQMYHQGGASTKFFVTDSTLTGSLTAPKRKDGVWYRDGWNR